MPLPDDARVREMLLTLLRTDKDVQQEVGHLILESAVMIEVKALREEMDKRFQEQREDTNKRFDESNRRFDALVKEMRDGFTSVRESISALGGRWGIQNEEAVRAFARDFIGKEFNVTAESWRRGDAEVDVVVRNGKHFLIEVTSWCDEAHLRGFMKHAQAYERATHKRPARRLVVTAHATGAAWQLAQRQGVEIISG